ncbi:Zinc finger C2H2 type domain-containing protein [Penicillium ucsense]|uniref:Zinc finger C2H2 type domain-containing protein n=1 Tax=Penicillium ucsense TaxID=2839758 RepID=A0A8J8WGF2_9EURO|nr:Zinc finger C2H2 type domain-containing protein [Penicillium ucsense]KAF7733096.1 Zinc finger C2H2 type domain-containing protein [Penicillium ucsense]
MRARYSPTSFPLDYNRESRASSGLVDKAQSVHCEIFASTNSASQQAFTMDFAHWKGEVEGVVTPNSVELASLESRPRTTGPSLASTAAGLSGLAINAQSSVPYSQPTQDMVTFIAPESHLSDRESITSDPGQSLYSFSGTSADVALAPATNSSFHMDPYNYTSRCSQPAMLAPFQSASGGYTPQQINKWCMESEPGSSSGYQSTASYPAMNPLAVPTTGLISSCYPAFDEDLLNESAWSSVAPTNLSLGPGVAETTPTCSITNASGPIEYGASSTGPAPNQAFLSPTLEPFSNLSTSPATTVLSEFEQSSSSHRPSSPPSNSADLSLYGISAGEGVWRCAHPGCTSHALFRRGCDLRKHFNRHRKHLFCRHEGCPQSTQGGFSSKKDRARHEAKHNPGVICEWEGCERVFSRVDNMKDHVRRIHRRKGSQ